MEIVDNLLWFPGYSVYLTDWCKAYLGLKLHSPQGLNSHNLLTIYEEIIIVWYAHHVNSEPKPLPPRLYHLELAYNSIFKTAYLPDKTKSRLLLPSSLTKRPKTVLEHLKRVWRIINE